MPRLSLILGQTAYHSRGNGGEAHDWAPNPSLSVSEYAHTRSLGRDRQVRDDGEWSKPY